VFASSIDTVTSSPSPAPGVEKPRVIAAAGEIACASLPPLEDPDH